MYNSPTSPHAGAVCFFKEHEHSLPKLRSFAAAATVARVAARFAAVLHSPSAHTPLPEYLAVLSGVPIVLEKAKALLQLGKSVRDKKESVRKLVDPMVADAERKFQLGCKRRMQTMEAASVSAATSLQLDAFFDSCAATRQWQVKSRAELSHVGQDLPESVELRKQVAEFVKQREELEKLGETYKLAIPVALRYCGCDVTAFATAVLLSFRSRSQRG